MSHSTIYEQLNSNKSEAEKNKLLKSYLSEQVAAFKANPDRGQEIAYAIAGLLSTSFAQALPEDSSVLAALDIASQLELPEQHRQSHATWPDLIQIVDGWTK